MKKNVLTHGDNLDKDILGVVCNDFNFKYVSNSIQENIRKDKTKNSRLIMYSDFGFLGLIDLLESHQYYKVIFDDFFNDDIDDLRDFIINCEEQSIEAIFLEGQLSTNEKYDLKSVLDALTYNV